MRVLQASVIIVRWEARSLQVTVVSCVQRDDLGRETGGWVVFDIEQTAHLSRNSEALHDLFPRRGDLQNRIGRQF